MHVQSFGLGAIRSVTYEAATEVLTVYWHDGRRCAHFMVPEWVMARMVFLADPHPFYLDHVAAVFPFLGVTWASLLKPGVTGKADQSEIEAWEKEMSAG